MAIVLSEAVGFVSGSVFLSVGASASARYAAFSSCYYDCDTDFFFSCFNTFYNVFDTTEYYLALIVINRSIF